MSNDPEKKADPIEDVRKGLGLLFRAATTAVSSIPTEKFETAVVSSVKEVGRALENVAQAIDKEVFKKETKRDAPTATQQPPPFDAPPAPDAPEKPDAPVPPPPPGEPTGKDS